MNIDDEKTDEMVDDWIHGMTKMNFCIKYSINEHTYKIFNKELKLMGVSRLGGKKGSISNHLNKWRARNERALDLPSEEDLEVERQLAKAKAELAKAEREEKLNKKIVKRK
jgi:hypothetical protein